MRKLDFKTWMRIVRAPFFTAAVPVLLGTAIAWHAGAFYGSYFLLALIGTLLIHAGLNVINDYFDHQTRDDDVNEELTPFSGGSRTIQNGVLLPRQVLWVAITFLALGTLIGLYLTAVRGWMVLWIGLAGMFLVVFTGAPPIKLNYLGHGLGELACGLGFGPLVVLGAYYVQTQRLTWEVLWASLPVAFLITAVIYINEFPDYRADKATGKKTLVVVLGKERAVWGYVALMGGTFVAIPLGVALGVLPLPTLLAILTLPLAWRGIRGARRFYGETEKLLPTNAATIMLHLATGLLLCVGYAVATVL